MYTLIIQELKFLIKVAASDSDTENCLKKLI